MRADPFAALREEAPDRFATPERCAELSGERFTAWPTAYPTFNRLRGPDSPLPVAHLGFVRNERFRVGNEPVIPGTNRAKQRKNRKSEGA